LNTLTDSFNANEIGESRIWLLGWEEWCSKFNNDH